MLSGKFRFVVLISKITNDEHFVPFSDLSEDYINAVISVEDHRYYEHGPVDFIGITRALYTNIRDKKFDEGGSTITQQVAKNVIFNQDKTLIRKIGEIFGAFDLEKNYTKNEILALYVNSNYKCHYYESFILYFCIIIIKYLFCLCI